MAALLEEAIEQQSSLSGSTDRHAREGCRVGTWKGRGQTAAERCRSHQLGHATPAPLLPRSLPEQGQRRDPTPLSAERKAAPSPPARPQQRGSHGNWTASTPNSFLFGKEFTNKRHLLQNHSPDPGHLKKS